MLKKRRQRDIIIICYIIIYLFLYGSLILVNIFAQEEELIFEIKPIYEFSFKAGRDPFEPRILKEQIPAIVDIDISTFKLVGITESQGVRTALFISRSGSSFGFIFIDGVLYGENNKKIPGITGEIRSKDEVLLRQGDREVLFKLSEDIQGPNIKSEGNEGNPSVIQ